MSWHFTEQRIEKIARDVRESIVRESIPFGDVRFRVADLPRAVAAAPAYDDSDWELLPDSRSWGSQTEVTAWLRARFTVPESWQRGRVVAYVRNVDCETIGYVDGLPIASLDGRHYEIVLSEHARPGATYLLALEAYSGLGQRDHPNPYVGSEPSLEHRLAEAEFRLIDSDIYGYWLDLQFAFDTMRTFDKDRSEYGVVLKALDDAVNVLDFRGGVRCDRYLDSVRVSRQLLHENLYDKYDAGDMAPVMWATGHSHIDTAWLWRLAHTRKKCERTFTTMLNLIERYPKFVFSCSQPQHYQYVKEDNSALYERIKAAVKQGSWVPLGGMWVEPDCNVVSGESFVRQFLYGMRFTQEELNYRTKVLWLPDVFGYSAALPQIMKKSGIDYFMTIKIFWNQVNRPPYQTFIWKGIDGTGILSHFSPYGDYNAELLPANLQKGWKNYDQKHLTNSDLWIYGYGDGGGGVTEEQLEYAERAESFIGLPKLKLASPEAFFADLEEQVRDQKELPVWRGELYFELHRGTYTSEGANKRNNRQCEVLLQTAEQIQAMSHSLLGTPYPADAFLDVWRTLLLNQFHDILPGSSINEVYRDSDLDYARICAVAGDLVDRGLAQIAHEINATPGSVVLFNPLSWARDDVVEVPRSLGLPGQAASSMDGEPVTVVELHGRVPSIGYCVIDAGEMPSQTEDDLIISSDLLENRFFRIRLDAHGEICSLFDKRSDREVIDKDAYCRGNALLTFEDKPMLYEAWDIDIYYTDKMYPLQQKSDISVIETGPIRGAIQISRVVDEGRGSTIRQRMYIYRDYARIDFVTDVEWKERQTLLKVAFPVTVNALSATYDIQFGNVERPTHWNTTWDWARFEVCGHKWADLSEGEYGVSLLSDSKYGWDIKDNVMRLTLLRGAIHPNPLGDIGTHHFTYSLYPHAGSWRPAETIRRAYELNIPVKFATVPADSGKTLPSTYSLVRVDQPNIIVETVKKAEDDDSIVVRAHDQHNSRGTARLIFAKEIRSAQSINLTEDGPDGDAPIIDGAALTFEYKPYEIRTFKVTF